MRPLISAITLGLVSMLNGCAVREHAFDCTNIAQRELSDELVMTPTTLKFQSKRYRFREEQGVLRIYEAIDSQQRITFNVASGLLQTDIAHWQCKKFSLDVERR